MLDYIKVEKMPTVPILFFFLGAIFWVFIFFPLTAKSEK